MNPAWFVVRLAGAAVLTAAGVTLVLKYFCPKPSDLVAGALHFRKGFEEFQKGLAVMFPLGGSQSADEANKQREATRIPIE
jgi:hypothetical protein